MTFDRADGNTQVSGDLLTSQPVHRQAEHLQLPWRQIYQRTGRARRTGVLSAPPVFPSTRQNLLSPWQLAPIFKERDHDQFRVNLIALRQFLYRRVFPDIAVMRRSASVVSAIE